ncbi:MAG: phosphopantetheine-binding protein [Pseudomonadota bacterium]
MQAPHELVTGEVARVSLHVQVVREIRRCLAPFHAAGKPITGSTVISDGVVVDSLTVMDMIMELEDRFEVSLPMNVVAEVRTVDQLAVAILRRTALR